MLKAEGTEIALKKRMPREGLPVCSIRLPTRQLPRLGLPIREWVTPNGVIFCCYFFFYKQVALRGIQFALKYAIITGRN